MDTILFLKPVFQERIWGGHRLYPYFPELSAAFHGNKIGECWAISAHKNGQSIIENGPYAGWELAKLYQEQPSIFGFPEKKDFPLLVKILDASSNLSVQVHPDDAYGLKVENELGKTECWYVLACDDNASIIYGHTAKTRAEFAQRIEDKQWAELLSEIPIKKGDFFYVPSGTIHAIKEGTLILEVQQSSDTTYRLYDYDRVDEQNNPRMLHIEKSIAVTTIPHKVEQFIPITIEDGSMQITTLVQSDFFTVQKIIVKNAGTLERIAPYLLGTVSSGTGFIDGVAVQFGSSFIVPNMLKSISITGDLELIISWDGCL
ncbi:mannose-6-phosphate isomerase, class I [Erysipelotrichaceae bacterium]|nr:mannose-6-phosphate isomerase, class I [Erysipelotrichaceae bacterium]